MVLTIPMGSVIKGPEEAHRLSDELTNGSDRSLAIVGGALVERFLEEALIAFLHTDKKITNELFDITGPLGAFASKIRLAKLVGLIGEVPYVDLMKIKDIRNQFAHKLDIHSFDDQRIKDRALGLRMSHVHVIDPVANPELKPRGPHMMIVQQLSEIHGDPRDNFALVLSLFMMQFSQPTSARMPQPLF